MCSTELLQGTKAAKWRAFLANKKGKWTTPTVWGKMLRLRQIIDMLKLGRKDW